MAGEATHTWRPFGGARACEGPRSRQPDAWVDSMLPCCFARCGKLIPDVLVRAADRNLLLPYKGCGTWWLGGRVLAEATLYLRMYLPQDYGA